MTAGRPLTQSAGLSWPWPSCPNAKYRDSCLLEPNVDVPKRVSRDEYPLVESPYSPEVDLLALVEGLVAPST